MKYRKKPIEVNAWQITDRVREPDWVVDYRHDGKGIYWDRLSPDAVWIIIPTLEGFMKAHCGDWIIQGVKGELYACRKDIFEETYEATQ